MQYIRYNYNYNFSTKRKRGLISKKFIELVTRNNDSSSRLYPRFYDSLGNKLDAPIYDLEEE